MNFETSKVESWRPPRRPPPLPPLEPPPENDRRGLLVLEKLPPEAGLENRLEEPPVEGRENDRRGDLDSPLLSEEKARRGRLLLEAGRLGRLFVLYIVFIVILGLKKRVSVVCRMVIQTVIIEKTTPVGGSRALHENLKVALWYYKKLFMSNFILDIQYARYEKKVGHRIVLVCLKVFLQPTTSRSSMSLISHFASSLVLLLE